MNLVFVFAIFHVILIYSDTSRSLMLKTYILSLATLGFSFGFYRSFLRKYFNNDFEYEVKDVKKLNEDVSQLQFSPVGRTMGYQAGQFVFVRF
jgi:predicted ferric reductase